MLSRDLDLVWDEDGSTGWVGVVSTEVGRASQTRLAVRMGLFMYRGFERRDERGVKGCTAERA